MDLDTHPSIPLVRRHLVEHLGAPLSVHGFEAQHSRLALANMICFAPSGPTSSVFYVTVGASLLSGPDGRRSEMLLIFRGLPPTDQVGAIQHLLAACAQLLDSPDEGIDVGMVLEAGSYLAPLCRMDTVVFVPPFLMPASFQKVALRDAQTIDLLWLLPVYEAEADYACRHGIRALVTLFGEQHVDATDPQRAPAVGT